MRDIRQDLQDRINHLTVQLRTEQAQFAREVEQIEQERDNTLKGLKSDLEAVHKLIGAEQRRMADTPAVPKAAPQPQEPRAQAKAPQKAQQAQPAPARAHAKPKARVPLSEMLGLQRAS